MGLMDFLAADALCPDLKSTTRDEALAEFLQRLIECGYLDRKDQKALLASLLERERLGSTAIGKGVAVPHCKGKTVPRIIVTFGRSKEGLEFKALDGEPVHAIFMVVYPAERPPEYLQVMESISRVIQNPDFRRFVANAKDGQEILDIIQEMS